jgi:hypothetical protein
MTERLADHPLSRRGFESSASRNRQRRSCWRSSPPSGWPIDREDVRRADPPGGGTDDLIRSQGNVSKRHCPLRLDASTEPNSRRRCGQRSPLTGQFQQAFRTATWPIQWSASAATRALGVLHAACRHSLVLSFCRHQRPTTTTNDGTQRRPQYLPPASRPGPQLRSGRLASLGGDVHGIDRCEPAVSNRPAAGSTLSTIDPGRAAPSCSTWSAFQGGYPRCGR